MSWRHLLVVVLTLASGLAQACSWATADFATHGKADSTLPPVGAAPDVRFERFEHFPGVTGTSCDQSVDYLSISVSPHHVQDASLAFERLPGSVGGSPIPPGSFVSHHMVDGRVWFDFVSSPVASGRLLLRAWTVSSTGQRSAAATIEIEIPAR